MGEIRGRAIKGATAIILFIAGLPLFFSKLISFFLPPLKKVTGRYEAEGSPLSALTIAIFGLLPLLVALELLDSTECDIAAVFMYTALILVAFASLLLRYDFISCSGDGTLEPPN